MISLVFAIEKGLASYRPGRYPSHIYRGPGDVPGYTPKWFGGSFGNRAKVCAIECAIYIYSIRAKPCKGMRGGMRDIYRSNATKPCAGHAAIYTPWPLKDDRVL